MPTSVFDHVDHLAAPRLVEYWEQDPCSEFDRYRGKLVRITGSEIVITERSANAGKFGVKIEGHFGVGEYEVLILSAKNSLGLDGFLRAENYKIPAGAEPYLRPYVAQGRKFFVAKVDAKKVKFDKGQAMLSPLRFHYDSETFNLPVRLGLINSAGTQDLIVHILARSRYEVANYDNVTIPTNLRVNESVRGSFGTFYAALFDDLLAKNPHAVVTEYAWSASSCDPCPEPPLTLEDMGMLGMDVLPPYEGNAKVVPQMVNGYTLTRLHARYDAKALGEDPRVCAMVPPPRFHMVRFHGVLAPNSALREQVVASARPYVPAHVEPAANAMQLPLFVKAFDADEAFVRQPRRKPWAWLLRHVFGVDVMVCPKCAGPMRWSEVALTPDAIREGLMRWGMSARGPPKRKRVPLGQLSLPFPKKRRE